MSSNYAAIIHENLNKLFTCDLNERAAALPAHKEVDALLFKAFGARCRLTADGVTLDGQEEDGPKGIIISLYALHAVNEACLLEPFKAFKEMPDSAPYAGAFVNRTEQALAPVVVHVNRHLKKICAKLHGGQSPSSVSGDFSFVIRPLPKIALCYVCYLPDEEFPAGVTCLYSRNAHRFLPTDALADVGEYTSREIIKIVG